MGKYGEFASDIIKHVGGRENIVGVMHCMTRLRFTLVDEEKANDAAIKATSGVLSLVKKGGQYQVVVGNHVPDVWKEVLEQTGISPDSAGSATRKNVKFMDRFIDLVSGIFMPSIGILCASGMIKGFLAMFVAMGMMATTDSAYILLYAIGDAMFYFLPIVIGFNAAKKFGSHQYVGLIIGAAFCYPTVNNVPLTFFGTELTFNYFYTVIPVIATVAIAAVLEKQLNKFIPAVVKSFFVPMLVLVIAVPLGFLLLGPIATWVGTIVMYPLTFITAFSPILGGMVIAAVWQVLVVLGIHMPIAMVGMIPFLAGEPSFLFAVIAVPSFAQLGVVAAVALRTKNKQLKGIAVGATVSAIFGITEPAIYGVTLPRIKLFVVSCIGAAIGGIYVAATSTFQYTMAGTGIFAIPGFIDPAAPNMANTLNIIIAMAIAMVFSFVVTIFMFRDEKVENKEEAPAMADKNFNIQAPVIGDVIPLNQISDTAFASGALGKGVAIVPTEGRVIAPFNGTVKMLFPTLHAIGLESHDGVELLIHVGMDTVQAEGKHFKSHVKQGDVIKSGDTLLEFDIEGLINDGYNIETPIIVTNTNKYLDIFEAEEDQMQFGDNLLSVVV